MKNKLLSLLIIAILFAGIFWYFNSSTDSQEDLISISPSPTPLDSPIATTSSTQIKTTAKKSPTPSTNAQTNIENSNSRVIFAVTDKSTPLGGIKSVYMNIEKLWVYNDKLGWQDIKLGNPKTYDLIELQRGGTIKLLYDTNLPVGNYTEIQMKIGTVVIIPIIGNSKIAKILSPDIKFGGRFTTKAKESTVVIYDFILDKSLHLTTDNEYIFAPVIEERSTNNPVVEISPTQQIKTAGGTIGFSTSIGIDENGLLKQNYSINPNVAITILANDVLKLINPGESDTGFQVSAPQAISLVKSGGYLTVIRSIKILKESENTYWIVTGTKVGTLEDAFKNGLMSVKINSKTGVVVN